MTRSGSTRADRLQRAWSTRSGWALCLRPLSWVYGALVAVRKRLYAAGMFKTYRAPVPVIVVGNVVTGGAGKTPVTIAVVQHLVNAGWTPGVVSRGYGRSARGLQWATPDNADPALVGDEPALIAQRCQVPVAVAAKRSAAAAALLARYAEINVLVCDDGLQHLALARDVEICVWNRTGAGNGCLLPAGPLREPWPRPVDLVLHAGDVPPPGGAPAYQLKRCLEDHAMAANGETVPLSTLASGTGTELWALAGTAHPDEFFSMLSSAGLVLAGTTALPDHYNFESWERTVDKRYTLIFTEKDAVKLWPRVPDGLAVRLAIDLPPAFFSALDALLAKTQRT